MFSALSSSLEPMQTASPYFRPISCAKINANPLPKDILGMIFQLFDMPTLGIVAQVCKNWESVQQIDTIWKRICLAYLDQDDYALQQKSYKEQCKILKRWMTGAAHVQTFAGSRSTFLVVMANPHHYTFGMADDVPVEIRPAKNLSYAMVPCIPGKAATLPLNNLDFGKDVVCTNLFEEDCIVLDKQGNLSKYHLKTGKCLKYIDPNAIEGQAIEKSVMCTTREEIVVLVGSNMKIWNKITAELKSTISLKDTWQEQWGQIHEIHVTNDSVFCLARDYYLTGTLCVAINKKAATMHVVKHDKIEYYDHIAASGSHIAILEKETVRIFEEKDGSCQLQRSFKCFSEPSTYKGSLHFYKNWLVANKNGRLVTFNLNNGKMLACINHGLRGYKSFCINDHKLCVRGIFGQGFSAQADSYMIYDFTRDPEPAKSPCIIS